MTISEYKDTCFSKNKLLESFFPNEEVVTKAFSRLILILVVITFPSIEPSACQQLQAFSFGRKTHFEDKINKSLQESGELSLVTIY